MSYYKADLAHIHDVGFSFHSDGAAPNLLQLLQRHGIKDGHIVDLGCGSGIWAKHLVDAGYAVTGFDQSPEMISLSRRRAPKGRFIAESFLAAELPNCRAVTALGEVFCYLFDKRNSIKALARLFRRIHKALEPSGLLIFDMAVPGRGRGPKQRWWLRDDWALLLDVEEDKDKARLTRKMTIFRKDGDNYRRDDETHVLQLYRANDVAGELRRIGFRARTVRGYGDYRFDRKGLVGFIARKVV